MNAFACKDQHTVSVMVWNYHDDDLPAADADVELVFKNIPSNRVLIHHYRIDQEHSNAYTAWQKMGSPQQVSEAQYSQLEKAGGLELLSPPAWVHVNQGTATSQFRLPRQGVSLLRIELE